MLCNIHVPLQIELKLAVALFVSRFTFKPDSARFPYKTVDAFAEDCSAIATMSPRRGVQLLFTPRGAQMTAPAA